MKSSLLSSEKTSRVSRKSLFYIYRNAVPKLVLRALCFIWTRMLAKTQYELPVITNEKGDTISYSMAYPRLHHRILSV